MESVLRQINSVAGTIGSMVCDGQGRLLAHVFPALFDRSTLRTVVTVVTENVTGLFEVTGGVNLLDLRYQNGRVVIRKISGGYIILLCESSSNFQLITISMNIAQNIIEKNMKDSAAVMSPVMKMASTPVSGMAAAQAYSEQGPLTVELQELQSVLAKLIGPMAKIIFLECVERWISTHGPTQGALSHLVEIIVKEMDDPAKRLEYRQRVARYLA
jgi:hypothetical protein